MLNFPSTGRIIHRGLISVWTKPVLSLILNLSSQQAQGWARVSPISCIMMNQKSQDKAKDREAKNPTTLGLNRTPSKAGSTSSLVEQHCKSHADLPNLKEVGTLSDRLGSSGPTTLPVRNPIQKYLPDSFLEGKKWMPQETALTLHHLSSNYALSQRRASKCQNHTTKYNVTMVPIKNIAFLPPINSKQKINCHVCRGKKTSDAKTLYKLEKTISSSQTQLDVAACFDLPINSTAQTYCHKGCQQKPSLCPAVCVSVPRRQISISPKIDTVHPTRYSVGKNLSQAMEQPRGLFI